MRDKIQQWVLNSSATGRIRKNNKKVKGPDQDSTQQKSFKGLHFFSPPFLKYHFINLPPSPLE